MKLRFKYPIDQPNKFDKLIQVRVMIGTLESPQTLILTHKKAGGRLRVRNHAKKKSLYYNISLNSLDVRVCRWILLNTFAIHEKSQISNGGVEDLGAC